MWCEARQDANYGVYADTNSMTFAMYRGDNRVRAVERTAYLRGFTSLALTTE